MSFISGILSDIKSLATDPGKVAKDICDAVLPQNMKAIGDVVGGAIDVETGNPLQALNHIADALKDLPQMAQGAPGTTAGKAATPAGTAAAEPTPPPTRAPSLQQVISELTALAGGGTANAKPAGTTTSATPIAATPVAAPAATTATTSSTAAATTTAATAAPATTATQTAVPATGAPADASVGVSHRAPVSARVPTPIGAGSPQLSVSLNVGGTPITVTESVGTRIVATRNPTTGATAWQQVPTTPTFTVTTRSATATPSSPSAPTAGSAAATATPATAAAGTAAAASAPTAASSTVTTTTATAAPATAAPSSTGAAAAGSATGAAPSTGTAAAGSAATPSSLSSLMSMSNDQFMQAVTSGNIPADVANNPSAMAEIQARMNQITQMNQLVTSMMAAMHQMQMAIIQNIRV